MSNLSVSDWITFLSNERNVSLSTVLGFGAVLIVFISVVFATQTVGLWQQILHGVVVLVFAVYASYKVFKPFGKRSKVSTEILEKIISGELNNGEDIQKAWLANK